MNHRTVPIDIRLAAFAALAVVFGLVILAGELRDDTEVLAPAPVTGDGATVGPPAATGAEAATGTTAPAAVDVPSGDAATPRPTSTSPTSTTTTTTSTTVVPPAVDDGLTAADREMVEGFTISDPDLQPKSVVVTDDGLFFLQNMMYRHNISVYDRQGVLVKVIPDEVDLADFGVDGGVVQGSPVEAAVSPDGAYVYVANYQMFGPGWNPSAGDACNKGNWDDSFVYKIDTSTLEIVALLPTGPVPKHLAVSPDGTRLVVSNWCGFDVSVIDLDTETEVGRVDVGRHPRGVAITSDSRYAYIAVMGGAKIDVIDLDSLAVVNQVPDAGTTPRHIILSNDDRYLYVSNHTMNSVRKIDLRQGGPAKVVHTGTETRTMTLSDDGTALYIVNYRDGTMSKVRTSDMTEIQQVPTGYHPIGVAYDPATRAIWVANYAGTISVYLDR